MIQITLPRPRRRARIEIVPLIDVVFFLLATFVLVSMSMVKNQGIPVKLPGAHTSTAIDRQAVLTITIPKTGPFYLNKESVEPEALNDRLRAFGQSHTDPKIILQGDGEAAFERIVHVLDQARTLGLTKIAIQTKKPAS